MAYMLSESGSDWKTIKVAAITPDGAMEERPSDTCKLVRFSCLTWTLDGLGFFYCKCALASLPFLMPTCIAVLRAQCQASALRSTRDNYLVRDESSRIEEYAACKFVGRERRWAAVGGRASSSSFRELGCGAS